MKIICDSSTFAKSCMNVQRTVSGKSTIPSLEGILIEADGNDVRLTGYDLEVGSKIIMGADVISSGRVVLNAKNLCDILRMVPDDTVSLDCDDRNICKIKSGDAEYSLIGISAEDYPDLPVINKFSPVTIKSGILKDMIRKTIFAVSTGERNPVHTGVKFEVEEGKIVLVAVDGARLAIRREEIDYREEPLSFVVPAKTLNEILKINCDDDEIQINVGDRHIIFKLENYEIISRLLEGNFLNYKAAVPMTHSTEIIVDKRSFVESIERTSLIITDRSSPVRCVVENGIIKFSSVTAIGTASDRIAAEIQGENIELGFNNRFVLDCLKVCDEEKIKIHMTSSTQPIIFLPMEGESFLFLVLPVRI